VSGSSVLNLCGYAARALAEQKLVTLRVNWLPDRSASDLAAEFARDAVSIRKKQLGNFLVAFVARRLADRLCAMAGIPADRYSRSWAGRAGAHHPSARLDRVRHRRHRAD